MTIRDVLELNKELLEKMYFFGIKTEYYKYAEMYKEYERMKSEGDKVTYIVAHLSSQYGICERKVYQILDLMKKECVIEA